jgi:hypothetical protein
VRNNNYERVLCMVHTLNESWINSRAVAASYFLSWRIEFHCIFFSQLQRRDFLLTYFRRTVSPLGFWRRDFRRSVRPVGRNRIIANNILFPLHTTYEHFCENHNQHVVHAQCTLRPQHFSRDSVQQLKIAKIMREK